MNKFAFLLLITAVVTYGHNASTAEAEVLMRRR